MDLTPTPVCWILGLLCSKKMNVQLPGFLQADGRGGSVAMCASSSYQSNHAYSPLLILVNAMGRAYREYLLRSASRGFRVWLFQDQEPGWAESYIAGYTELDTRDVDLMINCAREVGADGILCWDETRIMQAAEAAHALGLPGNDPAAVWRCRDKHLTRTALAVAGIPQPVSLTAATVDDARAALERIGCPVVVKPRALTGSFGVAKVESVEQLEHYFSRAAATTMVEVPERFQDGVLVEEYLDGPEVSIDSVCFDGRVVPLFLARKQLGYPPYFEELGHVVNAADPLLHNPAVTAVLEGAHAAVGFHVGCTHVELRLTSTGPKVVEINARLGGDLIPYLGQLATGVNAGLVAAACACGLPPCVQSDRSRVAGIRFCYPEQDTVAGQVEVDESLLPTEIDQVVVLVSPGQRLSLPPVGHVASRFAAIITIAETGGRCCAALDAAEAAVRLSSGPIAEKMV